MDQWTNSYHTLEATDISSSWHVEQVRPCFVMAQLLTVDSGPRNFFSGPP